MNGRVAIIAAQSSIKEEIKLEINEGIKVIDKLHLSICTTMTQTRHIDEMTVAMLDEEHDEMADSVQYK